MVTTTKNAENTKEQDMEIVDIRNNYERIIGKVVANSKKNDAEWMMKKIAEATPSKVELVEGVTPQPDMDNINKLQAESDAVDARKAPRITTTKNAGATLSVTPKSHAIYKSFMQRTGCSALDLANDAALGKHSPNAEERDAIERELKINYTIQIQQLSMYELPKHIQVIVRKYGIPLSRINDMACIKDTIIGGGEVGIEKLKLALAGMSGEKKATQEKLIKTIQLKMANEVVEMEAYIEYLNNNKQ